MADLFVVTQGSKIKKKGEVLIIQKEERVLFEAPAKNFDTIFLFGNISITPQTIKLLMEDGIDLSFFSIRGKYAGRLSAPLGKNIHLRQKQFQLFSEPDFTLSMAKEIILLKMNLSLEMLRDAGKKRKNFQIPPRMYGVKNNVASAKEPKNLLGLEGIFSKDYFEMYGKAFTATEAFQGRNRRPPKDPANALLSLSNSLITARLSSLLEGSGLDPYYGFYHTTEYGRVSLAVDLMEPMRPAFTERLTLTIMNKELLKPTEHFMFQENGVLLNEEGRRQFFKLFNDSLFREKNYMGIPRSAFEFMQKLTAHTKYCIQEGKSISLDDFEQNTEEGRKPIVVEDLDDLWGN